MTSTLSKDAGSLNNTQYFKINKKVLIFITVVSIAVNVLFLVLPLFSMQVFDRVLSSESRETLVMLAIVALFLLSIQALLDWVRGQSNVALWIWR